MNISGILDAIPCTWRGVPIQIYDYTITKAPQTKLHMGAYWTKAVVEDLGKAPVEIRIRGFIDPDWGMLERPALEAMIVASGGGILTLPSKGVFYAHCMGASFREDISNIVDVDLEFVEVKSSLGGLLGDLLDGSLVDTIGEKVSDLENSALSSFSKFTDGLGSSVKGFFAK